MHFTLGLLFGVAFYSCLLLAYRLGRKQPHKPPQISEEEKRKAQEMQKHFRALMNYDTSKALQRKRVI